MPTPVDAYLAQISADFERGLATELMYRSALEPLLKSFEPARQYRVGR